MSYAHSDNKYGQLSEFRERLSSEVQIQIGEEFSIFQDRDDILLGQSWRQRIERALQEEVTFLIPVVTPSFFKSQACRGELELFLQREKALQRNDLVFPIYYVSCRVLEDERLRATDPLAAAIASRQWADWRGLRFEPFDSPQSCKALMQIATQIAAAIERVETAVTLPTPTVADYDAARQVRLFMSYAHRDEGLAEQLRKHLLMLHRTGMLQQWAGRRLSPDQDWAGQIADGLERADIILLLISPDFLASDYCYDVEVARALKKHEAGEAVVIPVILRACDWGGAPFAKLQALPSDARPVATWRSRDEALNDVVKGIRRVAEHLTAAT